MRRRVPVDAAYPSARVRLAQLLFRCYPNAMQSRAPLSEGKLLFLIGAVQFVNVLDFMMVMPLGPDFAKDLGIASSKLGLIGGTYTLAAALSGIGAATFLDRFDRRKALAACLFGLAIGTAMGGLATGFYGLLAARAVAGVFGGPATSIALAIIADVIPVARRGRAMGAVMGAFSVASVLGVPAGLELARIGGWQLPFLAVGGLCLVVNALSYVMMPPVTAHLAQRPHERVSVVQLLARPLVQMSLSCTLVAMVSNFAMIPNLSTYVQFNLGYPRDKLGLLYLSGGLVSFVTLRIAGRLADKLGPARTALIGTSGYLSVLFVGFIAPITGIPVLALFVTFMITSSFRFVPMQALSSRVPHPDERGRFMSAQSAVQHLASAAGAMLGSSMLTEAADGKLIGLDHVAIFTALLASVLPVLLFVVERRIKTRDENATPALADAASITR